MDPFESDVNLFQKDALFDSSQPETNYNEFKSDKVSNQL